MNVVQDPTTGIWHRPDAGEDFILKEQSYYSPMDVKGREVMDVGANIGSFAIKALNAGAKWVYCYEPFPETFTVLKKNQKQCMSLHEIALVGDNRTTIDLYLSKRFPAAHSTVPRRGREKLEVKAANFRKELDSLKPTALKIDCEGTEYEFGLENLPDYVEEIGMELHLFNKDMAKQAIALTHAFKDWNYHKRFRFNWNTTMLIISRTRPGKGVVQDLLKEHGVYDAGL
jgi:FkbM family methyltransferase